MRTYEDVKLALQRYKSELEEEIKVKTHYVVVGGNICITKKGASNQYVLGKGDPVPMVKDIAKKNMDKFKTKVTGDMNLKIVPYHEWLQSSIDDCEILVQCMLKTLTGEPTNPNKPTDMEYRPENNSNGIDLDIEMTCPTCPLGVKLCMICKFCTGVKCDTYPWQVICGIPIPKEPSGDT